MTPEEAIQKLHDAAALWAADCGRADDVVRAACDALVAGVDAPGVVMVAAASLRHAEEEVGEFLPAAFEDLGLPYFAADSMDAIAAALKVQARRVLSGELAPRDLTRWAHRTCGHDRLQLASGLADLDDVYDAIDSFGPGEELAYLGLDQEPHPLEATDADVFTEARRIVGTTVR